MTRLPLRDGKSTPEFVAEVLSPLGKNPHGEPLFRLIWSERKQIYWDGEIVPEYAWFEPHCWVLETWVPPMVFAGPEENWNGEVARLSGPYPRHGEYFHGQSYPSDWYPNDESVEGIAKGILESRRISMNERRKAIRRNLEFKAAEQRTKVAEEIMELQDSASMGRTQQAVSGPKNTFRTPDDYGRDVERVVKVDQPLPRRGGKVTQ